MISTNVVAQHPVTLHVSHNSWDQFLHVFAPSPMASFNQQVTQGGYIYMVNGDAELIRFRHFGFNNGSTDTATPINLGLAPAGLHEGWKTLLHMFAARL